MDQFEDGYAVGIFAFQPRRGRSHLKRTMYDGIQVVSGTALAACTWNGNFHPMWSITFSAMTIEGVLLFVKDAQCYLYGLPITRRQRVCTGVFFPIGTLTYIASVHAFSNYLKQDKLLWIPWLGIAVWLFCVCEISLFELRKTASINTEMWRIINNLNVLLFGPALILGTFYYLVIVEKHDKQWLVCLPLLASSFAGKTMPKVGYLRERIDDWTWSLYRGLELMVGGFTVVISSSVLYVYSVNNNFHPLLVFFFFAWVLLGRKNIRLSLGGFQVFTKMEELVLHSIFSMIEGQIIFLLGCIGVRHASHIVKYACAIIAGIGLLLVVVANRWLSEILPRPTYVKYSQRVLGPTLTAYSSLASVYAGYRMGWRYSSVMIPFISAGIYCTYRGFSRRNRHQ